MDHVDPNLPRNDFGWYSHRTGKQMPIVQYGTSGHPLLLLPSAQSDLYDCERFLLIRSIQHHIFAGRVTVFSINSVNADAWMNDKVPVPVAAQGHSMLSAIEPEDAKRALCLWVNSPGNPTGMIDDLGAAAAWGRANAVPVISDECYVEFTWNGPGRTILEHGLDGVLAVHSLSKRSNLAGARAGFYAGDGDLVQYLSELRKHAGFMVPGPVQAAAVAAWDDQSHVLEQRERYRRRLARGIEILGAIGVEAAMPDGAFYLWAPAPEGDAWALVRRLAAEGGALVSPGEFYGPDGSGFIRVAVVQSDERLDLVARRLGV